MDLSSRHEILSKSPNSFKWPQKSIRHFPKKCINMIAQNDRNGRIINILKYGESDKISFPKKSLVLRLFLFCAFPIKIKKFSMEGCSQKIFFLKSHELWGEQLTSTIRSLWRVNSRVGGIWKICTLRVSLWCILLELNRLSFKRDKRNFVFRWCFLKFLKHTLTLLDRFAKFANCTVYLFEFPVLDVHS